MIINKEFKKMIIKMGFSPINDGKDVYEKKFSNFDCSICVDFESKNICYPEEKGFIVNDKTTCNFEHPENFVVFECVCRLLNKGYRPEHLELEKRWNLGHDSKGGKADICVHDKDGNNMLCIIECKTDGAEFTKELNNTKMDGGQLFSYWQQERSTKWLILYSTNFENDKISYTVESINCTDDANILELAKKDKSIKTYKTAHSVADLYEVWKETYEKTLCGDIIFGEDTQSYNIGIKPLRKKDLIDFKANDKIVNKFEEILRHNNVSDKENAFNRLIALFICKLVDEINKAPEDVVEFQYKAGTDTYESLQDRLQRLHKQGMDKFMKEEIFYVADDYAEKLIKSYTGQKREKMIADLQKTLRILKFYTNNDFAFKDVHNEELFYQNGKVLVEVVQLFEKYRIIESNSLQLLGDLFEQLLNKGFKQNEGQFFTPIPITRFIWDSLPLERIIHHGEKTNYPRIIDYACGAGHFLTEGYEAVNASIGENKENIQWVEKKLYGIEKDYRLARVSKISLFMHGAGAGNIIFGDGLENYPEKSILPNSFDILVANPPYSVSAFKPHLNLKNNKFELLDTISNNGSEIETLFVERISQLVKSAGVAAVVLPSSILNKENNSFIGAREFILSNFYIRAIVQFGSKTFGATGTNTIVLFLEKFDEPPRRTDLVEDSINAIFANQDISDWEDTVILREYLQHIGVSSDTYIRFVLKGIPYSDWKENKYFEKYVLSFESSTEFAAKTQQKTFKKTSKKERNAWLDSRFYEITQDIEREKIKYFALVYKQTTLIINAPDDNKEEEKFLGYKWSNRKGAEGIRIIKAGGMLYDEKDRSAEKTLASVVKKSYASQMVSFENLDKYYYYLRLQDMLNFDNVSFNKTLKTIRTRKPRTDKNLVSYKLSDKSFDISIGDRVLAADIVDDGKIPVYSANVFEVFGYVNKKKLQDFSVDSVIWGIDGDWMVNCIPAGTEFYPTDHCGVLRIKNDQILPQYMAVALQVEGEYERFSRSNRASTERIRDLTVQVPPVKKQQKIVNEINSIDRKISSEQHNIDKLSDDVKSKFAEMFGNNKYSFVEIGTIAPFRSEKISKKFLTLENYITTDNMLQDRQGISKYTGTFDKVVSAVAYNKGDILVSNIRPYLKKIWLADRQGGCSADVLVFTVKDRTRYYPEYIYWALHDDEFFDFMMEDKTGLKMPRGDKRTIPHYLVPDAEFSIQKKFANYVYQSDKLKFEAQDRIRKLKEERQKVINKYFH